MGEKSDDFIVTRMALSLKTANDLMEYHDEDDFKRYTGVERNQPTRLSYCECI